MSGSGNEFGGRRVPGPATEPQPTRVEDIFIPGPIGQLSVRVKSSDQPSTQAVILVQGSNLSGQSMFDLSVPGGEDYSLMDAVVRMGFTAIAFALRGYAQSTAPDDPFSVTTETAM